MQGEATICIQMQRFVQILCKSSTSPLELHMGQSGDSAAKGGDNPVG